MKKIKFILPILLFLVIGAFGHAMSQGIVDKSADRGLMVRQIPGSESDAIRFFADLPIESDTIYATIFRPGNCPRCDGFINVINHFVKKCTTKPNVLIAVYNDSTVAREYIERYDLKADYYMYDTCEDFDKFLNFSPGYLHVGYVLKINKSTGELIVGSNADNVSEPFFTELNNYNIRKEPLRYAYQEYGKTENIPTDSIERKLNIGQSITMEISESLPKLSEAIYRPIFKGDDLLWNDKLLFSVLHFKINGTTARLKNAFAANQEETKAFVNIPEERYQKALSSGQLKNIPLQPFFIDDDKIGIAYSLPELWMEPDNAMGYRNMPCYIIRSLSDDNLSDLKQLKYDYNDAFYYPHFNMIGLDYDRVVVGVERMTWPLINDKSEYMDSKEKNPFQDYFYDDYVQPTLAVYDGNEDKITYRFGQLPSFAKKAKTGYSFSEMVFDVHDGTAVYASIYDGNIYVSPTDALDCPDCAREYRAFDLDDNLFQAPDSTDYYTYNCNALASPLLTKKIRDIKTDDGYVHCIISSCHDTFDRPEYEQHQYVRIDRMSGERTVYNFPQQKKDERRIVYGLRRLDNSSVQPYYVSKQDGTMHIVTTYP